MSDNKVVKIMDAATLTGLAAGIGWIAKKVVKENFTADPSSSVMNYAKFTAVHCAKSQIFGPEYARIRIGARRVYRSVLTYSITADSKYTWNILSESGLFFRIQIEYS